MIVQPIINKSARISIFVLRIFGMFPNAKSSRAYIQYGYFVILVFSLIYTFLMVCEMFRLHDWSSTEAFYMTVTEVALVVKILNFRIKVNAMTEMMDSVYNFELESDDEVALLRFYATKLLQGTIFYFVAVAYAQSSVEVAAALEEDTELPYPAWYPFFNWKNNRLHYWTLYAYQVLGMFITAYVNISLELFGAMLMSMNTFQMEILGMRLRKLGYSDRGEMNEQRRFSAVALRDVQTKLIRYLKHHQAIGR